MSFIKLLPAFVTVCNVYGQFSCKNRDGESVDWFVGYKMPKTTPTTYAGVTFHYADGSSDDWGPAENLESFKNAIAKTLDQYYKNRQNKETFYLLYNDQKQDLTEQFSNHGHAKGVALFGDSSGFWLIHSVPRFPPPKRYFYVNSGKRYGQSFLCITMNTTSIQVFANTMNYIYPAVYSSQLPARLVARFPFLQELKSRNKYGNKNVRNASLIQRFQSKAGKDFIVFSKTRKYGKDLYADLIAPQLKTSIYTETWMNGASDLPSECDTQYKVMNVDELKVADKPFKNSNDHSKWAVAEKTEHPVVCVGDINRQDSQKRRGGGAVCFEKRNIWKLYRNSVLEVENCKIELGQSEREKTPENIDSDSIHLLHENENDAEK